MNRIIQPGDDRFQRLAQQAANQQQMIQAKANFLIETTVVSIFSQLLTKQLHYDKDKRCYNELSSSTIRQAGEQAKLYAPYIVEVFGLGTVEIKESKDGNESI